MLSRTSRLTWVLSRSDKGFLDSLKMAVHQSRNEIRRLQKETLRNTSGVEGCVTVPEVLRAAALSLPSSPASEAMGHPGPPALNPQGVGQARTGGQRFR